MATVVLGTIGAAVGGPVGGFVGGTVGAFIDNKFLFPALFPPEPVEGPRLGELQLQSVDEGSPITRCFGPEIKVPGMLIWVGDIIEVEREEDVGGKGGGGGSGGTKVVSYEYFVDVAVAICHGEISEVTEIWADSKRIYNANINPSIASTQIGATDYTEYQGVSSTDYLRLTSPNGGPDLTTLRLGIDATTAGFVNAGNNGTRKVVATKLNGDGSTQADLLDLNDTAVTEAAGASVTVTQNGPLYDRGQVRDGFNIYLGTGAQMADPIVEADEGSGNVPGFRHVAYFVAKRLALANFGHRIPNFKILVEAEAAPVKVKDTIGDLIELSGRTSADYDVSDVDDSHLLLGYAVRGPQPSSKAIAPLLIAYDLVVGESQGKLVFRDRFDQQFLTIDEDKLTAHRPGEDPSRLVTIAETPGVELPKEINVGYIDKDHDQDRGTARERRISAPANNVQRIDLPVVLAPATAREIAKRELWKAWTNRKTVRFSLPISFIATEENDRLRFLVQGQLIGVLVTRVTRGAAGVIDFEAIIEEVQVLEQDATTDDLPTGDFGEYDPPVLEVQIFDVAALTDAHTTIAGFYVAVAARAYDALFISSVVHQSLDDGDTYQQLIPANQEVAMGRTLTTLSADGPFGWFDKVNTVDVELFHGTLESRTETEVLNGMNRAAIGNEVIGFADATLIGTNQYRLGTLLRGLRGSEVNMDGIQSTQAGVRFILLNAPGLQFAPLSLNSVGTPRLFKGLPFGEDDLDAVDPVEFTLEGGTIKPWAPEHRKGTRDGSNNLTITWFRRTRAIKRLFSAEQNQLLENEERYELDVLDAPGGNVLRTFTMSTGITLAGPTDEFSASVVYTAAQQTADGLTPGNPVDIEVFQLSDTIGRGRPGEETV